MLSERLHAPDIDNWIYRAVQGSERDEDDGVEVVVDRFFRLQKVAPICIYCLSFKVNLGCGQIRYYGGKHHKCTWDNTDNVYQCHNDHSFSSLVLLPC